MDKIKFIITAITFIIAGLIFCILAFYMRLPKSASKATIYKPAGIIFYIFGIVTLAVGIVICVFYKEFTKAAFQITALIYLIFVTIIFSIFTFLIKDSNKNEKSNS